MFVGGCASNASIDLAKLGVPVSPLRKARKKGLFGHFVYDTCKEAGVDVRGCVMDEGVQTTTLSFASTPTAREVSFITAVPPLP